MVPGLGTPPRCVGRGGVLDNLMFSTLTPFFVFKVGVGSCCQAWLLGRTPLPSFPLPCPGEPGSKGQRPWWEFAGRAAPWPWLTPWNGRGLQGQTRARWAPQTRAGAGPGPSLKIYLWPSPPERGEGRRFTRTRDALYLLVQRQMRVCPPAAAALRALGSAGRRGRAGAGAASASGRQPRSLRLGL